MPLVPDLNTIATTWKSAFATQFHTSLCDVILFQKQNQTGMVAHIFNLSTQEAEVVDH